MKQPEQPFPVAPSENVQDALRSAPQLPLAPLPDRVATQVRRAMVQASHGVQPRRWAPTPTDWVALVFSVVQLLWRMKALGMLP